MEFQIFAANEITSSNCHPAALPKQKKIFGEVRRGIAIANGGRVRHRTK
ncbi:MAG: hypothetical protein HWQ38_32345 [Nostoc sp. NMS7]|nr:hypothetical protein [Nostoc sp. NMS7]MBN3950908.1 hypothetical protein [Nostoc sp. NMS7]